MLYKRILAEYERLKLELTKINQQLSILPEGNIFCIHDGKRRKWFKSAKPKPQYLTLKQRPLAEKLACRKYLLARQKELLHEKTAIDFYLRHHHTDYGQSEELLTDSSYQELLAPYFSPLSEELNLWASSAYEKSDKYPEKLIHKTSSGIYVRSKSEAMIDMLLYTNKIPFRYECALNLEDITLYPDFTIRHPQTGQIYYWEHFGLIDVPYYQNIYINKMQTYLAHSIFPSVQLITTFETHNSPLSIDTISKLVEHYFL